MAQIFLGNDDGTFDTQTLEGDRYRISWAHREGDAAYLSVAPARGGRASRRGALLHRASRDPGDANGVERSWLLVPGAHARLRVNGEPRNLGVAALRHGDEVRLDAATPFYFSSEKLAAVEIYAGDDEPKCPRCAQSIQRGHACVACPACGVRHHQSDDLPCWTYALTCVLCDHATDLDAGLQWTPEEL